MVLFILTESLLPAFKSSFSLTLRLTEVPKYLIRDVKLLVKLPSQILFGLFNFFHSQRRAVGCRTVFFIRSSKAYIFSDTNKCRLFGELFRYRIILMYF